MKREGCVIGMTVTSCLGGIVFNEQAGNSEMHDPFWQRAILAAISPLLAAFVGTLVIGLFAARITDRIQVRRQDRILREQLIVEMTQVASGIYIETQRFWRATKVESTLPERVADLRTSLDERYLSAHVAGEALETRLRIYFVSDTPRLLWHAVRDLLTIRYFQLIGLATDGLLERNAGPEHTSLDVEQLRNPQVVLNTYRSKILEATRAVLDEPAVNRRDYDSSGLLGILK